MSKVRVLVDGAGTVGERVADAITLQPDMELVGITKHRPFSYNMESLLAKEYSIYSRNSHVFPGTNPFKQGLERADIVVCCLPGKAVTKLDVLTEYQDKAIIFQGGESHEHVQTSFVASCNYDEAIGKKIVRVVSCNTTALSRVLGPLYQNDFLEFVIANLTRRGKDPHQSSMAEMRDSLDPALTIEDHGHHAPDVKTVLPGIPLHSYATKTPSRPMHMHSIHMKLKKGDAISVIDFLDATPRIITVNYNEGMKGTKEIMQWVKSSLPSNRQGIFHGRLYEVAVWRDSVRDILDFGQGHVGMYMAIDQQSIVIPENVDAIRAMFNLASKEESMKLTNETLGILGGIKK